MMISCMACRKVVVCIERVTDEKRAIRYEYDCPRCGQTLFIARKAKCQNLATKP